MTPKQLSDAFAEQPDLKRYIAKGWVVVGGLVALFAATMGIAHYLFDVPIYDGNTGEISSPEQTATVIAALLGGGLLFVVTGTLLLRWKPNKQEN